MNKNVKKRGLLIQDLIRRVLLEEWDPLEICCDENVEDEYDSYIAGIYKILSTNGDIEKLKSFLSNSEIKIMDERLSTDDKLILVSRKLLQINVKM